LQFAVSGNTKNSQAHDVYLAMPEKTLSYFIGRCSLHETAMELLQCHSVKFYKTPVTKMKVSMSLSVILLSHSTTNSNTQKYKYIKLISVYF
jgi:hypothetical protein